MSDDTSKSKPRPEKFDEKSIAPRDDVHVHGAGLRCPFCHDGVDVEATDAWVACEKCLARHHDACWKEAGRCGGCGHDVALAARLLPAAAARPRPPRTPWPWLLLGAVGFLVLLMMLGNFVVYTRLQRQTPFEQPALAEAPAARLPDRPVDLGPRRVDVVDGHVIVDARGAWIFVDTRGGQARPAVVGLGTTFIRADDRWITYLPPGGVESLFGIKARPAGRLFVKEGAETSRMIELSPEHAAAIAAALAAASPGEVDIAALLAKHGYVSGERR